MKHIIRIKGILVVLMGIIWCAGLAYIRLNSQMFKNSTTSSKFFSVMCFVLCAVCISILVYNHVKALNVAKKLSEETIPMLKEKLTQVQEMVANEDKENAVHISFSSMMDCQYAMREIDIVNTGILIGYKQIKGIISEIGSLYNQFLEITGLEPAKS